MSEIPEEYLAKAFNLVEAMASNKCEMMTTSDTGYANALTDDANAIARALMEAEARGMEKAAKIARRYEDTWRPAAGFGDRAVGAKIIADTIEATAIRAGGKND